MENEFKVREVAFEEEKSVQEIEEKLLKEHEEKQQQQQQEEPPKEDQPKEQQEQAPEFKDEDVLSYIKNRYQREITSLDELLEARKETEELPEDVSQFLKYKKETGRGIEDFMKLNKDFTKMDPNDLLFEYMKENNPELDADEIRFEIEDKYKYDEDLDDEKDIKKKKVALKKELSKAKDFFESMKDKYKAPLESRVQDVPQEDKELLKTYKQQLEESKKLEDQQRVRSEFFTKKTEELFNSEFKGFEFSLDEKKVSYKPASPEQLKKDQADLSAFVRGFLDENGMIKDAGSYHKSIAAARNPDAFAKFFYDLGKSEAINNTARESKNIDMDIRSAPQSLSSGGFKVSAADEGSGSRLVIRSKK